MEIKTLQVDKIINDQGFEQCGSITLAENAKRYKTSKKSFPIIQLSKNPFGNNGFVYLWVKENQNGDKEIMYVGKAGKTMKNRMGQHNGGFRGEKGRGHKHALNLTDVLSDENNEMKVYVRACKSIEWMGEVISEIDLDEQALIMKLNPPWNG